jgi:protein-S-isoprenylcysteine O-methyltransferase Ste14
VSRSKILLASILFLIVQFGLTILGCGGLRSFFSHPQFVALLILTVVMMSATPLSSGNVSPGIKEDRSNRWVIGALSLIGFLLAYFPAYTDRVGFLVFGGDALRWVGVVLFTAGGALRIWPVFVLGGRFSGLVAIQQGHTLVTDGIYSRIRNPSYLGLLINMLGWAFVFRSGVGVLITALTLPILIARMNSEEKLLREYFDGEYEEYYARTSRLLPGIY